LAGERRRNAVFHERTVISFEHEDGGASFGDDLRPVPCRSLPEGHQTLYSGVIGRTQIYLGDDELELLDRVARTTGASRSELIRRAVRSTFGEKTKAERTRALEESAGAFHGRRLTGADYVDVLRGDLNERLKRQGLA
jgi:Arc/MetJ-type ribon-helix-helix transcriptional regulator